MDLQLLRIFREVAQRGSFAAAARALDLDPSVISRAISGLESRSGVRLVERSTRRLSLTEAGVDWLARIGPLVDDFDDAMESLRDTRRSLSGTLRVTASTAFGEAIIVPMLNPFLKRYPDLLIDLRLTDAQVDLAAERVDLAIRLSPEAPPDTVITKLCDTRYRVVAAPEVSAALVGEPPAILAETPCLRFALDGFRDAWSFRQNGMVETISIAGRIEMLGASALRQAALAGLGPALLADWLIRDDLESGRLVDCFPDYECAASGRFETAAWALRLSRQYTPRKTHAFLDMLRTHLAR